MGELTSSGALVLALDQGGQTSRAIAFDRRGVALARASKSVGETRSGDDRVEQDPEEVVRSLAGACDEVIAELGNRARDVIRAGLATQRSSIVCWDRADGTALSPVISWQDRRASARLDALAAEAPELAGEVHRRTGLFLSPHYGASKLAWCLENLPRVARARERGRLAIGPLASFLAYRLLEEHPFVVDPANASRTLCWSIETREWDPFLCRTFGVPRELLPACSETRGEHGTLSLRGARVQLAILTGDQSAAIFAQGEPRAGVAYVNIGTGAFVQRRASGRVLLPRLLTSVVASRGGDATFVVEGTINGAGSALRRIERELGLASVEDRLDDWLMSTRDPPLFLNGVSGLAAPYWAPQFASRFVGDGTPEARVVAVVESVVFLVNIILDEMSSALAPATAILASGGLTQSDAVCRRLADVADLRVIRAEDPEATARGVAWLAFDRAEPWSSGAATRELEPGIDVALRTRARRYRSELERALGLEA
jgi:glycerol kinase